MITYNYFGKEQKIYYEKLENGLGVYVIPNKSKGNYYVEIVTKYGSSINEFKPFNSSTYLKLPGGVAHFLEHKMFDEENGDAFSFYSKTGTYINAGTTFFCTRYYIDGKHELAKNLDYLLTMIYTPYFTDRRVSDEKGIIKEEIKMYDDEAEWVLDYETKKALFKTSVSSKIAGTCESIDNITADILNKTYDVFYQPSNMFLVACGNVEPKEIIKIVKNNKAIKERITNRPIIYKCEKEKKRVCNEYTYLESNIIIPKLSYSYKFDLSELAYDKLYSRLYLNLLFTYLFGETSSFNEKIIGEKIATDFYIDHISFDNIYALTIFSESEYADVFKDEVDKTLSNITISEDDFNRIKKMWISVVIRSLDNKENLAYSIIDDLIKEDGIRDQYKLIQELKYTDLLAIINKLDLSNKTFVLMMPKQK